MRDGYFQGKVTEEVDSSEAVLIEGAAGGAIFMHGMTPHASTTNRSERSRRTLILSYRAARFTMSEFPIPCFRQEIASLYELQEQSREGKIP